LGYVFDHIFVLDFLLDFLLDFRILDVFGQCCPCYFKAAAFASLLITALGLQEKKIYLQGPYVDEVPNKAARLDRVCLKRTIPEA